MVNSIKSGAARYGTGTLGLILVAIGVALSIKSDLGTAPISCPPYVVSLAGSFNIGSFTIGTVGQYTMLMHLIFILFQLCLLRSKFKLENLMQIPAAVVFGVLTDCAIWAFDWVNAGSYLMQLVLMCLSILVTALGISLEVKGNAWMLAGEMTNAALADVLNVKFRNVKIAFDIFLVVAAAAIAWFAFGNLLGNGSENVIRRHYHVSPPHRTLHEVHRQVGRRYGTRFRKEVSVGGVDDLTCELTPYCVESASQLFKKLEVVLLKHW